jgi:Zn-dependent M16 (insulinase) family peptidase
MTEDLDILPKVDLNDIPEDINFSQPSQHQTAPLPLTSYAAGTNGLVYQQLIMPMPELTPEQFDLLLLYSTCVTEMGVGHLNYQETQLWHSSIVGSYSASTSVRSHREDLSKLHGNISLACKGLASNQQAMSELMQESFTLARFDELDRLKELIAQILTHKESSVVSNGHVLAMMAASSEMSPYGHLQQRWGGMTGLSSLKKLNQAISSDSALAELAEQLKTIHRLVLNQPRQFLLVSEKQRLDEFSNTMATALSCDNKQLSKSNLIAYQPQLSTVNHCWTASTQVSFCAKAFPTVAGAHPDSAPLTLLGGILRNGFLHRAIREQGGAYGAGASQDSQSGAFRFFSYRDPRIEGTLADFDASVKWVLEQPIGKDKIEEAILGVIGSMDKPSSPAGEAIQAFYSELNGRSKQTQIEFRKNILKVNEADLKRVAEEYLRPNKAQTAVITNTDLAESSGLEIIS